jgi:hypothetical protein
MVLCNYCSQEMTSAEGCTTTPIVIAGESYSPVRYGSEWGDGLVGRRCADCNASPGSVHHHGCDVELCPACGRQSISCDCLWADEEHLAEDREEEMDKRFLLAGPDE